MNDFFAQFGEAVSLITGGDLRLANLNDDLQTLFELTKLDSLFQIADTSTVWVQADVFEQDIAAVNIGQKAKIKINAYPGEVFEGRIAYVYPTLMAETRTVPVRIELANPGTTAPVIAKIPGLDKLVAPASATVALRTPALQAQPQAAAAVAAAAQPWYRAGGNATPVNWLSGVAEGEPISIDGIADDDGRCHGAGADCTELQLQRHGARR